MVNRAKLKGDNEERAFINYMRGCGFRCERTLESGARSDESATWDINLHLGKTILRGECKIRKSGLKFIYDSLGENDFLTYRTNNNSRLVIMNEETFSRLLGE